MYYIEEGSAMSRSFIGRLIVATLGSVIGALTFVVFPVLVGNPALTASRHGSGIVIPHSKPRRQPLRLHRSFAVQPHQF